jgi:hypothetical protein
VFDEDCGDGNRTKFLEEVFPDEFRPSGCLQQIVAVRGLDRLDTAEKVAERCLIAVEPVSCSLTEICAPRTGKAVTASCTSRSACLSQL